MKPPVPENPDQINVITGHILLSFWLSSGQSWRTRRATPRPDLISCLGDLYGRPRWQPERGPRQSRPAAAGEPVISRV